MALRADSQNGQIITLLKERGGWVNVADLHRRAGTSCVVNSRISELRNKHGYKIEHRVEPGKTRAALANQYRLLDSPNATPVGRETKRPAAVAEKITFGPPRTILNRDLVPRDSAHRFRIYRLYRGELELAGYAPTEGKLGPVLCAMGRKGEFTESCIGLLDTYGVGNDKGMTGTWLISPWDTEPKEAKPASKKRAKEGTKS